MSTVTDLEKNMAIQAIASGIETPEEVAARLLAPLELIHNWCSTPAFRMLCRRYGQEVVVYQYNPDFMDRIVDPEPTRRACSVHRRGPERKQKVRARPKPKPKPKSEAKPRAQARPRRCAGDPRPKFLHHPCWKRVLAVADMTFGASKSGTARKYEVSRRTMDRWCDEAGVESRFQQGQRLPKKQAEVCEVEEEARKAREAEEEEWRQKRAEAVRLVRDERQSIGAAHRATGVKRSTIQDDCRKAGVKSRLGHVGGVKPSGIALDPKVDEAVELVRVERITYAEARRRTGVPESTTRRACKAAGVRSPWKYKRRSKS